MPPSFARYLLVFSASLVGVVGVAWVYTALAPMAFMESGYAAWAAKSAMLRECHLGQVALFGDSRLEAGVIPADLPVPASNFGLAAGTAVETRSAVSRALACPAVPRQAVIALVPEHFGPLSKFYWLLSIRYGFLSPAEVLATEELAARVGDDESLATPTPDGLGGRVRDWLYAARFPSLSFPSLVQGRVFGRYDRNVARFDAVMQDRGWTEYVRGPEVKPPAPGAFTATKLQTAELEAALTGLQQRGVETFLLIMPFAQSHPESNAALAAYRQHLAAVAQRVPGVHLLDDAVPVWPDRLFVDGAHLDAEGAKAFSARLASCFVDGRLQSGCDLTWHGSVTAASTAGSPILEMEQQRDRQH